MIQEELMSVKRDSLSNAKSKLAQDNSAVMITDYLDMAITVDWDVKLQTERKDNRFRTESIHNWYVWCAGTYISFACRIVARERDMY